MSTEGSRLSPQQAHLWALQQKEAPALLRAVAHVTVRGPLDGDVLDRALLEVGRKHEILRTTFHSLPAGEGAVQVVQKGGGISLEREDLSVLPAAEQDAAIAARLRASRVARPHPNDRPLAAALCLRRDEEHHDLVLSAPALCADRTSLGRLVEEIARCYGSLQNQGGFDLETLQYADVAAWQNELLEADDSRPGLRFWRQRDLRAGAGLRIPCESPATETFVPETLVRALDPALAERLAATAARHEVSMRLLLLGAWAVLLRRLGGQADVIIGVTEDGRRHEALNEPLGPLARSLPLPLRLDHGMPFIDVLRRVSAATEEMARWQECFAWEQLEPETREVGCLAYAFEYHPSSAVVREGELTFRIESRFAASDRFRCRLRCEQSNNALTLAIDYDSGVYTVTTIERLLGQLEAVLADVAERPDSAVGALDILSQVERRTLLDDFNATDTEYPRDVCVHHWIEEQARRSPDSIAVRHGDEQLTYADLDARANQLAHHLQARGVGPDSLVALLLEPSPEIVIGILAILKAGGAYVPVDPSYPRERILFLLNDTRAPVLLTQRKLTENLPEAEARVVYVDSDHEEIARHPSEAPRSGAGPDNLVYLIYTSGSTGKPKGVVITHEKLVVSNSARVAAFGHTPETFLLLSSVAFDSSVVGIFWTLCGGGTLVLPPESAAKDPAQIPRTVAEQGVTHLLTLPSFYRLVLESSRKQALESLRTVIVAGEACPLKMVEHHRSLLPGVDLFSEYGATETTVFSSLYDCLEQTLPIAPVGSPIDNAQMYVLDENLRPCPIGVPGEVHFGGIALSLGYWRRPGLTAERFIPNPLATRPGERLYKSGDLARHLDNGDVEFLGRLDNQVKIRGFRIELEEIEKALLAHPAIKESAVLALEDRSDSKRLVGYLLVEDSALAPSVGELRDFLQQTLPDFMVPAVFLFLEGFPRTPNGKVDRKALPTPGSDRPELDSAFQVPRSAAEQRLARIWADVLGLERVGVNDNFFELGGDSILSIQIVSRARQAGLKLTPRQLFENQTVSDLAEVAKTATPYAAEEQGEVLGAVPLTPVQQWFFGLDLPDPNHWNMPMLLEPRRPLAAEVLGAALRELLVHHDALRLRFARADRGWRQEIVGVGRELPLALEDLSGIPESEQPTELERRAATHQAALNLEHGPLMRAVLFDLGTGRGQRLLWIVHHLAVDGVSWRILLEDLECALDQLERGEPVCLPSKTTSYQVWARRLTEQAAKPELREEARLWRSLASKPAPRLPLDHPNGRNLEESARKVTVSLDVEQTRGLLSEVPRAYNTQINDVLLTALIHALADWIGETAVLVNLEGHGRDELLKGVDLSRTVGWFTTDFPLRLEDTSPFEPGAALRSMKEQLRRIPNQGVGFGVGRYLCPDEAVVEALASLPRPAVGFNYLGQFDQIFRDEARFHYSTAPSGPSNGPQGERAFALEVYGLVSGGSLEMNFEFSENLHERPTIQRLADAFMATLLALIEHCRSPDARGFTASDFVDFEWNEGDLATITSAIQRSQRSERPGTKEGR